MPHPVGGQCPPTQGLAASPSAEGVGHIAPPWLPTRGVFPRGNWLGFALPSSACAVTQGRAGQAAPSSRWSQGPRGLRGAPD